MISQTETSSNQYGFYAVPKKVEPKKKYRESYDEDLYDAEQQENAEFQNIERQKVAQRDVQKDFYVDEAPYPEFKPKQRGLDYGVQIQKGDLFDFELEVQPLIQILVGRSVVSAINQLQQDKERKQKKQKSDKYQKKRNAQLMVTQRLQAKSKRKQQESERRVLQKQLYVKNQKEAGKKLIARKNAKKALLGLKNQLFTELNEAGYLRSDPYNDLRINYEGWLYEHITEMISQQTKVQAEVKRMINEVEDDHQNEHKKNIEKQKARRKALADQKERLKKQNNDRKERKRIRKQKRELNSQRQPRAIKFDEILDRHVQVDSIVKFQNRSNGFTLGNAANNGINTVYISGGLFNYAIALLNSTEQNFTAEQIEKILEKLLNETVHPLQISMKDQHYQLVQENLKQLSQNTNEYMKSKNQKVKQLKQKISLNLKILEANKVPVKSSLHEGFLQSILNILLSSIQVKKQEQNNEGQLYEPNEKDKQRQQLKKKISLKKQTELGTDSFQEVLRVRFQRKYEDGEESKRSHIQNSEDEWIDTFDGQGWSHHCKQHPNESDRTTQKPAAITISPFENSFVYDERTLYYLQKQLQTLFNVKGGDSLKQYIEQLGNMSVKIKKSIPVYDGQVRIQ